MGWYGSPWFERLSFIVYIFELLTLLQTVPFILWVVVAVVSGRITSKNFYVSKFHLLSRDFFFLMFLAIGDKDFAQIRRQYRNS